MLPLRRLLLPGLVLSALLVAGACATSRDAQGTSSGSSGSKSNTLNAGNGAAEEDSQMAQSLTVLGPPPPTKELPVTETLHGETLTDPFRWLEEEKAPEVQEWMTAQDTYARRFLHSLPGRDALQKRLREILYTQVVSAPAQRAGRLFYTRRDADKEKAALYWRQGEHGPEKRLLDPNEWSPDGNVSLGSWSPSWDGKKVVFQRKPNAADEAVLHVVDVDTGKWSDVDVLPGGKYASPSWAPDSRSFYYEFLPDDPGIPVSERPGYTEIRHHVLGTKPASDTLIHPRTGDPKTFLTSELTRDGAALLVSVVRGWNENDLYLRRMDKKQKDFVLLVQGKNARYEVEYWKGHLYILTDEGAPRLRVFKASLDKPQRSQWKELIAQDEVASLESVRIVGGRLVLHYLKNAASEIRLASLDGKPVGAVPLPTLGTVQTVTGLEDVDDAYFEFTSFTVPPQVYRLGVKTGATQLWAKAEVPIQPDAFEVEQVWYKSKDGTRISMFIVQKKGQPKSGERPTLLYGYGGFNISLTPTFRGGFYPWLEAGNIFALANLRGGGEYGKGWHDAGRLGLKQNVFDDFIAAQRFLIDEGYTNTERLAIYGGSNGGLLVGASMTQRPDLVGAVVCAVPLLDMVRYHLFGSGQTWVPEYGSAANAKDFEWLREYSPYQNVREGVDYPPLLMMSADHDDRVDPMHARKFTAAIQSVSPATPALLRIERNAGHGGADQVKQAIDSYADLLAFLFRMVGSSPGAGATALDAGQPPSAGDGTPAN